MRGREKIAPTIKRRSAFEKDVLFLVLTLTKLAGAAGSVRFTCSAGSPSVSGSLEEKGPFPAFSVPTGIGLVPSRHMFKDKPECPCVRKKAEGDTQQETIRIKTVTKGKSNFFPA